MEVIIQVVEDRNYLDAQKRETKTVKLYDWNFSHRSEKAIFGDRDGMESMDFSSKRKTLDLTPLNKVREREYISKKECQELCTLHRICEKHVYRGTFVRYLRRIGHLPVLQFCDILSEYRATPKWSRQRLRHGKMIKERFLASSSGTHKLPENVVQKALDHLDKEATEIGPLSEQHAMDAKKNSKKRSEEIDRTSSHSLRRRPTLIISAPEDRVEAKMSDAEGPLAELNTFIKTKMIELNEQFKESDEFDLIVSFENESRRNLVTLDFVPLRVLGQGGFGKVHAVSRVTTGALYAQKECDKARIIMKKRMETVLNEINTLKACTHPFIVGLHAVYSDEEKVYIVLDLLYGGELKYHLKHKKRVHSYNTIRFWTASLILALEHMHSKDIVHRDLKPANVLLDEEGFIRVSDFGLSVMLDESKPLTSCCGTPGYIAPEMYLGPSWDKRRKKGSSKRSSISRKSRGSVFSSIFGGLLVNKPDSQVVETGQYQEHEFTRNTATTRGFNSSYRSLRSAKSAKSIRTTGTSLVNSTTTVNNKGGSLKQASLGSSRKGLQGSQRGGFEMIEASADFGIGEQNEIKELERDSKVEEDKGQDDSGTRSGGDERNPVHEPSENKQNLELNSMQELKESDNINRVEVGNNQGATENDHEPAPLSFHNKSEQIEAKTADIPDEENGDGPSDKSEVHSRAVQGEPGVSLVHLPDDSGPNRVKTQSGQLNGSRLSKDSRAQGSSRAKFVYPRYTDYGTAVDWWALGVIVHQMTCFGRMPFDDPTVKKQSSSSMLRKVIRGDIWWPGDEDVGGIRVSKTYRDLVEGLLHHDPGERYGSNEDGVAGLKKHPFFASINWEKLESKLVVPPFVPRKDVVNAEFQSNDWDGDGVTEQDRKKSRAMLTDEIIKQFEEINYTRPDELDTEMASCRVLYSKDEEREEDKTPELPHSTSKHHDLVKTRMCVLS